jgi:hypothetical protein
MKRSTGFIFAALMLCVFPAVLPASATAEDAVTLSQETPLMIIRFNQPSVGYPMPLYNTLSRALKVKPSAVFDVVSVAPHAKEAHSQSRYNKIAAQNTDKVIGTMHEIGLPDRRIQLSHVIDAVDASEVRIYVH